MKHTSPSLIRSPAEKSSGSGKSRILVIGALPPPFIGPSVAMQRLVGALARNEAFSLTFLDISDRRPPANIGKLDWGNATLALKHIAQCLWLLLSKRPHLVYLGISQGLWGYLRDLGFILPTLVLGRRLVLHLRGSEFRTFYGTLPAILKWTTRAVLRRTSRVIVLGHRLKALFADWVEPDRIQVIPNGIDYSQFDLGGNGASREPGGKRILFLSGLRKRKGILLLLEALPEVCARHPDVQVTVAGLWQSQQDQERTKTLLTAEGMNDRVTFIGEVSGVEKVQQYKRHNLFVFPPIEPEGLPWVILEAMSAGLPVITTDQGAIAEVVEDRKTGLIVAPEPSALARNICDLLDHPEIAEGMGAAGRRRVEEIFSEQVYLAALERVFQEAISETASRRPMTGPVAAGRTS